MSKVFALDVQNHNIKWDGNIPSCLEFQDIFFQADVLSEIKYVYLDANNVSKRFKSGFDISVFEFGFGFGLNFLCTLKEWIDSKSQKKLTYVSVDNKVPTIQEIEKIIDQFKSIDKEKELLLKFFKNVHNGINKINFDSVNVEFFFLVGNVNESIHWLNDFQKFDIWFLDGFDPKKNPEMWSEDILDTVQRFSRAGSTFSTFSSAGFIKRGMIERGFNVKKRKGFNLKRHHLCGETSGKIIKSKSSKRRIAVIGTGIAGSCVAYQLSKEDCDIDIFEYCSEISDGASGNPLAALYPKFNFLTTELNYINIFSFCYASRFYLFDQFKDAYFPSGVSFIDTNPNLSRWIEKVMQLNRPDMFELKKNSSDVLSNLKGAKLRVKNCGYVDPKKMNSKLLEPDNIKIFKNYSFIDYSKQKSKIMLNFKNKIHEELYDGLIIATGSGLCNYFQDLSLTKGHIVGIDISDSIKEPLNSNGYVLPKKDNKNWLGGSYEANFIDLEINHHECKNLIKKHFSNLNIEEKVPVNYEARAQVRTSTAEKFPIARRIEKDANVFVVGAFGSRGFTYGPIIGDHISAEMCQKMSPLPSSISKYL